MPVTNTGAESNGISAHGTIIKRNGTEIAELKDITPLTCRTSSDQLLLENGTDRTG